MIASASDTLLQAADDSEVALDYRIVLKQGDDSYNCEGTALFFDDPAASNRYSATYGATKTAQMQLVRNWQAEAAKTGPRVVIATPAPMPTATRARHYPGEDRARLADPRAEATRIIEAL